LTTRSKRGPTTRPVHTTHTYGPCVPGLIAINKTTFTLACCVSVFLASYAAAGPGLLPRWRRGHDGFCKQPTCYRLPFQTTGRIVSQRLLVYHRSSMS